MFDKEEDTTRRLSTARPPNRQFINRPPARHGWKHDTPVRISTGVYTIRWVFWNYTTNYWDWMWNILAKVQHFYFWQISDKYRLPKLYDITFYGDKILVLTKYTPERGYPVTSFPWLSLYLMVLFCFHEHVYYSFSSTFPRPLWHEEKISLLLIHSELKLVVHYLRPWTIYQNIFWINYDKEFDFLLFWSKTHYLSQTYAIPYVMLFYAIYLTNFVTNYMGIKIQT